MMANALALNGFDDIESCIGEKATRNGILESWRGLIRRTSSADAAVIYYSGHGGLVEPTKATGSDGHLRDRPSRRQFIVPTDYDPKANDFRGILDVELSHILQDTTCQTDNVTLILDCCHSGSMARDPSLGDDAIQRSLDEVQYHSLLEHQDLLLEQGRLPGLDEPHGNSKAVRIVAATTDEKAWEYKNGAVWNGAMTQALSQVLHECRGTEASWRTTMARVRELVGLQTLLQHPHAEGPVSRLHFSLSTAEDTWLPVGVVGGSAFIMAGHLREVYQGNEYSILPAGSAAFDGELEIASATVSLVVGFKAKLVLAPRGVTLPREGAVAFAKKIVLPRRPAAVSSRVPEAARVPLLDGIARSQYLRLPEPESDDHNSCLANLECDGEYLVLYNNYGVAISSQKIPGPGGDVPSAVYGRILRDAEQLARAQHLLTLKNMNILASITTPLSISVGVVEKMKRARQVETDGTGWLYPEERICVSLTNNGNEKCYVHVFNVNVSGEISLVTTLFGMGVPLAPGEEFEVGRNEFDEPVGLEVTWPRGDIPKTEPIVESLVFIQTDGPVDLHHLQGSAGRGTTAASSQLEQLADSIAAGTGRDVGGQKGAKIVRYQVSVKQFTLGLRVPTRGRDLLTPEAAEEDPQQRVRPRSRYHIIVPF